MEEVEKQELERVLRSFYQTDVPQEPNPEKVDWTLLDTRTQRRPVSGISMSRLVGAAAVLMFLILGATLVVTWPLQKQEALLAWPEPSVDSEKLANNPFMLTEPSKPGLEPSQRVQFAPGRQMYVLGDSVDFQLEVPDRLSGTSGSVSEARLILGLVGASEGSVAIPIANISGSMSVKGSETKNLHSGLYVAWLTYALTTEDGEQVLVFMRSREFAFTDQ